MKYIKKTSAIIFDELMESRKELLSCKKSILNMYEMSIECIKKGGTVLVCGNGGSAADCEHIVGELMKGFMSPRHLSQEQKQKFEEAGFEELSNKLQQAIPAISLVSHIGLTTAFANDVSADMVFAQQVFAYNNVNNILIAISTSGNSKNVLNAVKTAKALGIKTIALLGKDGGKIADVADCCVIVPEHITYKIQELHMPIYHAWSAMIEAEMF